MGRAGELGHRGEIPVKSIRRSPLGPALLLGAVGCTLALGDGRFHVVNDDLDAGIVSDATTGGGVEAARTCVPDAKQCADKGVQTCSADGAWQDVQTCPFGCTRGACTGKCVPGQTQCSGASKQTCDTTGAWQTTQTCPFVCSGEGDCTGMCSPGAGRCSGGTPQTCDETGSWQNQPGCAQPTPDCQAGTCTCLETVCGGSCSNTQTDAHNCGACAHDCQGASCQMGACQPTALASNLSSPWGIAVGGGNVYWTNSGDGTVMTLPAMGGGAPTTLATAQSTPMSIALDAANAYWVDSAVGTVMQCALAGCGGAPLALASGQGTPWGVAVDPTSAYWTSGSNVARSLFADAGAVAVGTDPNTAYPIAVDGTNAYWADSVGSVFKCAVGGCSTPTPLATSPLSGAAYGLAIDASNVYWTNSGTGTVQVVPKSGLSAIVLAAGQSSPSGIAVDATSVYWANNGGGTLMKVAVGGGKAVTVASGQSGPTGVAVDSAYVYWTNQTGGTVMRVVK
jgi:hypothetical protein